jgi:hypothetical protein
MRLTALVLAVTACGDPAKGMIDAAGDSGGDGQASIVTGKYALRVVSNAADRTPTIDERQPASLVATVTLPGTGPEPVAIAADGTFSFARHRDDERYALTFVTDDGRPTTYELAAPTLDIAVRTWGRYDRAATPSNTALAVTLNPLPAGTQFPLVVSTGLWTQTGRSNGDNANFTIDWTKAGSLSGVIAPLEAEKNDRLYLTTFEYVAPYYRLAQSCFLDVTMTPAAATPASCLLAPVAQDHCIHLRARTASEDARLVAATAGGPAYTVASWSWIAYAIPTPALGPGAALNLALYGEQNAPSADLDRDQITLGNPYPGYDVGVQTITVRSRAVAVPSATPANIFIYTQYYAKAEPSCATVTDPTASLAAIPGIPAFDGAVLDTDRIALALDRTQPHALTWSSPDTDYWVVRLFSLSKDATGATAFTTVRTWITADRQVAVDPADVPAGYYMFQIVATHALPGAAHGDFRTVGYDGAPYNFGVMWSGMFEVTE